VKQMCDVREKLLILKNNQMKNFSEKIINTKYPILGVKTEALKKLAKQNIDHYKKYIKKQHLYYEEYLIHGFMLGYLKLPLNELINYINDYIKLIDNWAMVDSIVSNLKIFKKYKQEAFLLAKQYINSQNEFEIRFGYCILLSYYICTLEKQYLDEILCICNKKHETYYVQKMVAWLLSVSYIKFKEETVLFLYNNKLDNFTYNKTISKICDSHRVSQEDKEQLKKLRRKYEKLSN